MNKRSFFAILGFLIFFFGFLSMIFLLFAGGLRFSFLSFIDNFGTVPGFVIRLVMIFGGIIMFYWSRFEQTV
ncbi:MAG: hypothetical protein HKO66_10850 [Saprospiraceae bacterium]|nr:hypothetical protein [Bacteroidia bacterium]NNE15572.1 hypothetical protein [Saprospiraceae bacterium]NNL92723.1 hypothetical protein [Saprospiraceae bacterium]